MGWLIWAGVLPLCLVAAFFLLQRPLRIFFEDLHVDQARESFHCQREWLEARFVTALSRIDPAEGARWEDAQWHDEVLWARDRQTRRFLALVCVHFDANPFDPLTSAGWPRPFSSTARGSGPPTGKRLDETRPDEVVGRNRRYEPVVIAHPSPKRVV